jgi:hypothetical protein
MLKYNNMNNINETREKLDELFSIYNTHEVRSNFNFAAFYGYCQGVLMIEETINIDIFVKAVEYGINKS